MSGFDNLPDDVQQRLRLSADIAEQGTARLWQKNVHDPELLALLHLSIGNTLWLLSQIEQLRAVAAQPGGDQ
jgi:hypothetical protein